MKTAVLSGHALVDSRDIFRPRREPAVTIYDAFQNEAKNRAGRPLVVWLAAERAAVWEAARDYAQQHDLRVPLMSEIESAERSASGHIDYGAKWAYSVERFMKSPPANESKP